MSKTRKKKPMSKAVAAALKVMENSVFETSDLEIQLKHVREKLTPAGIMVDFGSTCRPQSIRLQVGTDQHRYEWLWVDLAGMGLWRGGGCTALR